MSNVNTAEKENQRVTSDWDPILDLIDGVKVREVKNVMSDHSYVTEYFRQEWEFCERPVEHILQVTLCPGAITAREGLFDAEDTGTSQSSPYTRSMFFAW